MWEPLRQRQRVVVFLALWFAAAAVWTAWDYVRVSQLLERDERRAEKQARQQVERAVADIGDILREVERAAVRLAEFFSDPTSSPLSHTELSPQGLDFDVEEVLSEISGEKNTIFGLGAAFDPQVVNALFSGKLTDMGKPKPGEAWKRQCIAESLAGSLYAPYLRRTDDASDERKLIYVNKIYDYTCRRKYWFTCPLNLCPDACDLRLMETSDGAAAELMIDSFRSEYASRKDACAVLIVRAVGDSQKWIIAGFGDDQHFAGEEPPSEQLDNRQFRTVEVEDPRDGAWSELSLLLAKEQKNPTDRSRIVELATLSLGSTYPGACPRISEGAGGMWLEPYFGEASERRTEEFATPFYRPGGSERGERPIGVAWANMSLHELSDFLASLNIGSMGYSFLLSPKGVFIAHPRESQTDRARNVGDAARRIQWPELMQYFWDARDGRSSEPGPIERQDPLSGEDAWWYFRTVAIDGQADWVLGIVVLKDELMGRSKDDRRRLQMSLAISILLSVLPFVLLLNVAFNRDVERSLWWASMSVSIGLLLAIGTIWALALRYPHYAGTSPSGNSHSPPPSECALMVEEAPDGEVEQKLIRGFVAKFGSTTKGFFDRKATYECGLLFLRRMVDGSEQRTIAGFTDAREFRTVVIANPEHELWKEWGLLRDLSQDANSEELWKEKSEVVEQAKSSLSRGRGTGRMGVSGSDQWAPKILSQAQLDRFKKRYGNYLDTLGERRNVVYLPTGLYVQSLQFVEANAVRATGYVWQQLPPTDEACKGNASKGQEQPDLSFQVKTTPDNSRASDNQRASDQECTTVTAGVLFPEATSASISEAYRESRDDGGLTVGWDFDVSLRETFGYTKFPFDVENVWLRLWHKQIDSNVVLVPDLPAYPSVAPSTLPGLEAKGDFVLPEWDLESAYFGYRGHTYSSNFGLKGYSGEENFPELYFNILVKRKFLGPFISNVMPVLVVAAILFALVLTITRKAESSILGFNTSAVLASCAGLFFGILIGHTELRSSLDASGLVYIETFYLIMYGALLLMAVNTYVFSVNERVRILQWRDNLLPKLLYWPTLLLLVLGITWASFY